MTENEEIKNVDMAKQASKLITEKLMPDIIKSDPEIYTCIGNIKETHVGDEFSVNTDSFKGKAVVKNVRGIDKADANGSVENIKIIDLENAKVYDEDLNK